MNIMQIRKCNNISFEQRVPTSPLLKIGSGIFDFNDAKVLCLTFDDKFPGHVGYYKKAIAIADNIANKNDNIKDIMETINAINKKNDKLSMINKMVNKLGNEVDVVI